tara:strand:+ start:488 stop:589 length:102 start_codon:yes stop_codon:yes gene_type:complete
MLKHLLKEFSSKHVSSDPGIDIILLGLEVKIKL